MKRIIPNFHKKAKTAFKVINLDFTKISREHISALLTLSALVAMGILALGSKTALPYRWLLIAGVGSVYYMLSRFSCLNRLAALIKHRVAGQVMVIDIVCIGAILFCGVALLGEVVLDAARPITGDHSEHYFKVWLLNKKITEYGRVFGWSNRWFLGFPYGYDYPVAAHLLIVLFGRLLSHWISLSQTYALFVGCTYLLLPIVVYILGRNLFGYLAGVLAALLMLYDPGDLPAGGYKMAIQSGVWISYTSLSITGIVVLLIISILQRPSFQKTGCLALFCGFAFLYHPFQMLIIPVAAACFGLQFTLQHSRTMDEKVSSCLHLGLALLLGLAIAACWLLPFISASEYVASLGVKWKTLSEVAAGGIEGSLFGRRNWGFAVTLGFLLSLALLFSPKVELRGYALSALVFILFAAAEVRSSIVPDSLMPYAVKIEFGRLTAFSKMVFHIFCGGFAIGALRYLITHYITSSGSICSSGSKKLDLMLSFRVFLGLLIAAPLLIPFWGRLDRALIKKTPPKFVSSDPDFLAKQALVKFLNNLGDDGEFFVLGSTALEKLDYFPICIQSFGLLYIVHTILPEPHFAALSRAGIASHCELQR